MKWAVIILVAVAILQAQSIPELYKEAQEALASGDLAKAETASRGILAIAPQDPGAHVNLAVVYMRRKQWEPALEQLHLAQKVAPNVPGIRLDIGLVYYRQNRFEQAIPELESVLRDQPANLQAAYLLALCYVFTDRYANAVPLIERLWDAHSNDLAFLYVAAVAADGAHRSDLEQKAVQQMMEVGGNSAEVHLYIGKAYLARGQDDEAFKNFEIAARMKPKLPFVHYYLGAVLRRRDDLQRAKQEFLTDAAIEPDMALNYDQLGHVSVTLGQTAEAEHYFREALRLDPSLASSQFGLAKLLRARGDAGALQHINAAERLSPDSASVHYLKAQILKLAGRETEARQELATATRIQKSVRDKLQRMISGKETADPQLPGTQ